MPTFETILFLLVVICGSLKMFDKFYAKERRDQKAENPLWVYYGADCFYVLLAVFMIRSFLVEPFRIPSSSMEPMFIPGDFILVNKMHYGIKLPVIHKMVFYRHPVQRGDVIVFLYPNDTSVNYVKRVIAIPGDKIVYKNKHVFINGIKLPWVQDLNIKTLNYNIKYYLESNGVSPDYRIAINSKRDSIYEDSMTGIYNKYCNIYYGSISCSLPDKYYFVMGDNRDNSLDSRYWGFVPEDNILGKVFYIWMHADNVLPPEGIDFSRIRRI